jgi:hypothetical protein
VNKLARILAVVVITSLAMLGALPVGRTYADGPVILSATNYPGTVSSVFYSCTVDWTNPDLVKQDDGHYADAYMSIQCSYTLQCSNFGFNIPTDANITGVMLEVKRVRFGQYVKDWWVKLEKDNIRHPWTGDNKRTDTNWSGVWDWETHTYGSSADLWGVTWTPAEINDGNFSVHFAAGNGAMQGGVAYVDFIRVTVYYESPVEFADTALDTAMHTATGADPMYVNDIEALSAFDGNSLGVANLSGMEGCINLSTLYLSDNSIIPLSPLAGLTNLIHLNLSDNVINDILPLSGLVNLSDLNLCGNNISDISPLSGLGNLSTLELCDNHISDISPLSGLVNLSTLDLCNNDISNISPLSGLVNLSTLELCGNNISDISPLSGLDNLTMLDLSDNDISDISSLVDNPNISGTIILDNNPLDAQSYYEDIQELEDRGVTVTYEGVTAPKLMIQPNINVMMTIQALIFMLGGIIGILTLFTKGDVFSTGVRLGLLLGLTVLTVIGVAMLESIIVATKWM